MDELSRFENRIGLLVSVRDAAEAEVALDGGTDVIDVKEPSRGSLGAADKHVVASVVVAVSGRVPISVAGGELLDWPLGVSHSFVETVASNAAFIKFGFAGCSDASDWPARWQTALEELRGRVRPVAVAYADWQAARAPAPDQVLALAQKLGCSALLIDTWDKSGGDLFQHWPEKSLSEFGCRVRDAGIHLVLAGSLQIATLPAAMRCKPSLIAVRGAACDGDRRGKLSLVRVSGLRAALDVTTMSARGGLQSAFAV